MRRRWLVVAVSLLALWRLASPVRAAVLLEAEGFDQLGGWVVDQQFMDQMGSPYLLAHGLGDPVRDAQTTARFARPGRYHLYVRTRDWVAPWHKPGAPGRFQVLLNGQAVPVTFGTEGAEWHWQDGGEVAVSATTTVTLHDLMGFEGRCDALLFAAPGEAAPPNDLPTLTPLRRKLLGLPEQPVDGPRFDLVVVGGGIAGTCAAVGAARYGLTVALVQDRPVLGGNGSSEVRVWPEGHTQQAPYSHVGDLVSELIVTRGHNAGEADVFDDQRKLNVARLEPRLMLYTEQRVNGVEAAGGKIAAVVMQHTRTAVRTRLRARWFADCTGDGTVGYLAGANWEQTREGHMGASNLWNTKDIGTPDVFPRCLCTDTDPLGTGVVDTASAKPFPRCPWAVDLRDRPFPGRPSTADKAGGKALGELGAWFWESGFDKDPIADVEWMRDLNLRAMYGAWDTLKNVLQLYPNQKLNWAAYIAGKRESRRLLGDVVLTAENFRDGTPFPDGCFPCTWHIDLHFPAPPYQKGHEGEEFISGFTHGKGYDYAGPYWAPYRCLYSRNVSNLFMAGRDISVTHEALGPVRVMRTCGMMGEAVAMAASICGRYDGNPRDVYTRHLAEFKALLSTGIPKSQAVPPS